MALQQSPRACTKQPMVPDLRKQGISILSNLFVPESRTQVSKRSGGQGRCTHQMLMLSNAFSRGASTGAHLVPLKAVACRELEGVVVVVPALTEREDAHPPADQQSRAQGWRTRCKVGGQVKIEAGREQIEEALGGCRPNEMSVEGSLAGG